MHWHWFETWYAPVSRTGCLQSHCLALTAQRAWEYFTSCTRMSRDELKAKGYRVKRLRVTLYSMPNVEVTGR